MKAKPNIPNRHGSQPSEVTVMPGIYSYSSVFLHCFNFSYTFATIAAYYINFTEDKIFFFSGG
jgi:hypothetical protein